MGIFGKNKVKKLESIRNKASVNENYNTKLGLLQNCLDRFNAGDPEPYRRFLTGYFELKNMLGKIKQPADTVLDEGFIALVAAPVLNLMEQNQEPLKVLFQLVDSMPDFYKSFTATLALRHAQSENKWPSARQALETTAALFDSTGYDGPAGKIEACAKADTEMLYKKHLVEECLRAFGEGRPEHLRAFLSGYLTYKRAAGDVEKISKEGVDDGLVSLVSHPLAELIEKSQDPQKTIADITKDLSGFYRQLVLDLVLRTACHDTSSWYVTQAVLQEGADPNTGGGRAIMNAVKGGDERVITLLHKYGGDFKTLPAVAQPDFRAVFDAAAQKVLHAPARQDPPVPEKATGAPVPSSAKKLAL